MIGSTCFAYDGLTVRVESADPTHLAWLEEVLTPSFTSAAGREADCTVTLVTDEPEYNETLRRGPRADAGGLDCFSLDTRLIRLPLWSSPGAGRVIFDEHLNVFYVLDRDTASVRILARPRRPGARMALMRVVREFAMTSSWKDHRLIIHGAALALGDTGVVIAGPKRAGKTSLLIHLLQTAGAKFIANDRVVVDLRPPRPELRGMPTMVTVRGDTLDLFPDLGARLRQSGYDHCLSLAESGHGARARRPQRGEPLNLTPAQFCAALGAGICARSPLHALLFPAVTERRSGIQVRPLSSDAAASRLADTLFARALSHTTSEVFSLPSAAAPPNPAELEALCVDLTARVRCFDCELGQDAYGGGNTLAEFAGSILPIGPGTHADQGVVRRSRT